MRSLPEMSPNATASLERVGTHILLQLNRSPFSQCLQGEAGLSLSVLLWEPRGEVYPCQALMEPDV